MEKNKLEKKLPNRVDKPIEIPIDKVTIDGKNFPTYSKTFTFTASSVPSSWLEEHAAMATFPAFYTKEEKARAEIANLRVKARQFLSQPFSAGKAYNEFGADKFPMHSTIECKQCGNRISYIVDFWIHTVLDHGDSLTKAEDIFQNVLNRLETFL